MPLLLLVGCAAAPPAPSALEAEGLHNVYHVTPRMLSGSGPEGEAGFRSLSRLGVATIVSVDGAKPDAALARRFGIRTIHLPIGYDGVPRERALEIARAVRDLPGPVYVHCHHGKHRGPAAVAAVARCLEGWSPERAEAWLRMVGTGEQYKGLLAVPRAIVPASSAELDAASDAFPETAEVSTLARLMVEVDRRWEHLGLIRKAGWKPPADHPDLDPPHEARLLAEQYREMLRLEVGKMRGMTEQAERDALALERALRGKGDAEQPFAALGKGCAACHARFRDTKEEE
ncbi:MAG: hypothetical protein K2W96_15465 [Gemmataceae bacterium]|nr:hypothetical protein [Gemmataceae bacterium]